MKEYTYKKSPKEKFIIRAPSTRANKKYDVYTEGGKYVVSFGDNRYEHYFDKFGYYSHLNHGDSQRRKRYQSRHKKDYITDPRYAGYWSWNFLW
jgi:hypothetical protein